MKDWLTVTPGFLAWLDERNFEHSDDPRVNYERLKLYHSERELGLLDEEDGFEVEREGKFW